MNAPLQLVRYDAMVTAIAVCHSVDEVKDIRDKAMALQAYARQAKNTEAERKACDIRLRAERRAGELLKALATAGKRNTSGSPAKGANPFTLKGFGISQDQSHRWQRLATVPSAQFEQALRDPIRAPSTSRIIKEARDPQPKKMPEDALWLWGRARDFERDGFADKVPSKLLAGMTETMRADMARIVPVMLGFFSRLQEAIRK